MAQIRSCKASKPYPGYGARYEIRIPVTQDGYDYRCKTETGVFPHDRAGLSKWRASGYATEAGTNITYWQARGPWR